MVAMALRSKSSMKILATTRLSRGSQYLHYHIGKKKLEKDTVPEVEEE